MKKILKFLAAAAFAVVVYQLVSLHRKRRKMVEIGQQIFPVMSDGENSADPRYRGCAPCVASNQLRRVSSRFVSERVRCLRSAGRMRVCQIRIGRFCPGAGMLYR